MITIRRCIVLATCLFACSSENPTNDAGADASADVSTDAKMEAAAEAGNPDAGCNTVTNVGTTVPQLFVATDAVTGDGGGVIGAGTYVCTTAAVYTGPDGGGGPTGTSFRDTVVIDDAGAYERAATISNDAGASDFRENGHFILNGSSITITQTCPAGTQPFNSYDSNGATFHVYAPALGSNPAVMFEYTKQ